MAVELVYETHSISTDNEAGIATGWLPGRADPLGWARFEQKQPDSRPLGDNAARVGFLPGASFSNTRRWFHFAPVSLSRALV